MAGPEGRQTTDLFYWLALAMAPGIGGRRFADLLKAFGAPEAVLSAPESALAEAARLPKATVEALKRFDWGPKVEKEIERAGKAGLTLLCLDDPGYPSRLKEIAAPPPVLWVAGGFDPRDDGAVAIVGSRTPTEHGRSMSVRLARELAEAGLTVVSGLALGIDAAAHVGAMEAGGRTIGVLGCGVDVVYPKTNREIFERIPGSGALISEFPLGTYPKAGNFPQRNRVIAGLSTAVVVVEAAERSGALITARMALDENRDVMAVPGRPGGKRSAGVNGLIRQGALLVESGRDIIQEIAPQLGGKTPAGKVADQAPKTKKTPPGLDEDQKLIYETLGDEEMHVDDLGRGLGFTPHRLSALLLDMELLGLIRELPGKRVMRI